jgi:hypothetical protein
MPREIVGTQLGGDHLLAQLDSCRTIMCLTLLDLGPGWYGAGRRCGSRKDSIEKLFEAVMDFLVWRSAWERRVQEIRERSLCNSGASSLDSRRSPTTTAYPSPGQKEYFAWENRLQMYVVALARKGMSL